MFNLYFEKLKELLSIIEKAEQENIMEAAKKIAQSIQNDGIVHVFGCGHSHIFGEELFYRAGGLVPINPILVEDIMLHKGAVRSSQFEQKNDFAGQFMENIKIESNDVIIVVSTSGRNPVPIDVAEFARKKGAFVIAITSLIYSKTVGSRHKGGKYLADSADLVIDNHISVGDTLMDHQALDVSFGSGSTIAGAAIVNGIMVEAIGMMADNHFNPPIFISSNASDAEGHNLALIEKYRARIPLLDH